jgi:hypothetical protein
MKGTAHIVLDSKRHVIAACDSEASDIGSFISKHHLDGYKIYRVPKHVAKEVLYTDVPSSFPNALTA